jgi:predicted  nucleic acid-binding Zn-ribbon protein
MADLLNDVEFRQFASRQFIKNSNEWSGPQIEGTIISIMKLFLMKWMCNTSMDGLRGYFDQFVASDEKTKKQLKTVLDTCIYEINAGGKEEQHIRVRMLSELLPSMYADPNALFVNLTKTALYAEPFTAQAPHKWGKLIGVTTAEGKQITLKPNEEYYELLREEVGGKWFILNAFLTGIDSSLSQDISTKSICSPWNVWFRLQINSLIRFYMSDDKGRDNITKQVGKLTEELRLKLIHPIVINKEATKDKISYLSIGDFEVDAEKTWIKDSILFMWSEKVTQVKSAIAANDKSELTFWSDAKATGPFAARIKDVFSNKVVSPSTKFDSYYEINQVPRTAFTKSAIPTTKTLELVEEVTTIPAFNKDVLQPKHFVYDGNYADLETAVNKATDVAGNEDAFVWYLFCGPFDLTKMADSANRNIALKRITTLMPTNAVAVYYANKIVAAPAVDTKLDELKKIIVDNWIKDTAAPSLTDANFDKEVETKLQEVSATATSIADQIAVTQSATPDISLWLTAPNVINTLTVGNQTLQDEVDTTKKERDDERKNVIDLKSRLQTKEDELILAQKETEKLKDKLLPIVNNATLINSKIKSIDDFTVVLDDTTRELNAKTKEVDELEKEIDSIKKQLHDTNEPVADVPLNAIGTYVTNLRQEIATQKLLAQSATTGAGSVSQTAFDTVKTQLTQAQTTAIQDLATWNTERKNLTDEIQTRENERKALSANIVQLTTDNKQFETERDNALANLAIVQHDLANARVEIANKDAQIAALGAAVPAAPAPAAPAPVAVAGPDPRDLQIAQLQYQVQLLQGGVPAAVFVPRPIPQYVTELEVEKIQYDPRVTSVLGFFVACLALSAPDRLAQWKKLAALADKVGNPGLIIPQQSKFGKELMRLDVPTKLQMPFDSVVQIMIELGLIRQ